MSNATIPNHIESGLSTVKTSLADSTQANSHSALQLKTHLQMYFDKLYSDNGDPWQYQTRWYEKRKRDSCLALLPQAHYNNAIELGCGNGVFSELLASRCQALLSIDGNNQAVQLAEQRLVKLSHVNVIQGLIPEVLCSLKASTQDAYHTLNNVPTPNSLASTPPFDLIVISEILYYLSLDDIDTVITWIKQNLAIGGTLLCCHWRYAIDGFAMTGESVHQRLQQAFTLEANTEHRKNHSTALMHQSQMIDTDFLLDIWQNSPHSVAGQENLL